MVFCVQAAKWPCVIRNPSTITTAPPANTARSFKSLSIYLFFFFFVTDNSLLSFGGPQLYNSEALPFTYDQYVVIELADNSITLLLFVFV